MRRSIDDHLDDHPADDEDRPPANWAVGISDDCEACDDVRVVLTLEAAAGLGLVAHLAPVTARRLRVALADALKELGQDPGS
jgi:hypothetical protein